MFTAHVLGNFDITNRVYLLLFRNRTSVKSSIMHGLFRRPSDDSNTQKKRNWGTHATCKHNVVAEVGEISLSLPWNGLRQSATTRIGSTPPHPAAQQHEDSIRTRRSSTSSSSRTRVSRLQTLTFTPHTTHTTTVWMAKMRPAFSDLHDRETRQPLYEKF